MEDKKRRYINVLTKRYTQTAKWKCCRLAPGIRAIPKARYKHTLTKCSWRNILVKLSNCNIVNPDKRTKSITALFNATILTQQKPYVLYAVVSKDFFSKIKQALKTKHYNFRQISRYTLSYNHDEIICKCYIICFSIAFQCNFLWSLYVYG